MRQIIKVIAAILLCSTVCPTQILPSILFHHAAGGFNGFSYVRAITLNLATYNPATQSNFTVLICAQGSAPCNASVSGLNQSGAGAHVKSPNGYDIVFTSDVGCTTNLKWEMEHYVASTGEVEAWILISSLGTSNATIYMCYGNSGIATFQGGAVGSAWDSSYKAVYHFAGGSTSDSTSNANTLTNNGTVTSVSGISDGGANYTSGYGSGAAITPTTGLTAEAWVSQPSIGGSFYIIVNGGAWYLGAGSPGNSGQANNYVGLAGGGGANPYNGSVLGSTNTWYFDAMTFDGSNLVSYANATAWNTSSASGTISTTGATLVIGDPTYSWHGSIDEVRISTVARSGNWLTAEYNNISSPSTFVTFGSET